MRSVWNGPASASHATSNNGTGRLEAITLMSSAPAVPPAWTRACAARSGIAVTTLARTRLSLWNWFGKSTVAAPSGPTLSTVT